MHRILEGDGIKPNEIYRYFEEGSYNAKKDAEGRYIIKKRKNIGNYFYTLVGDVVFKAGNIFGVHHKAVIKLVSEEFKGIYVKEIEFSGTKGYCFDETLNELEKIIRTSKNKISLNLLSRLSNKENLV